MLPITHLLYMSLLHVSSPLPSPPLIPTGVISTNRKLKKKGRKEMTGGEDVPVAMHHGTNIQKG